MAARDLDTNTDDLGQVVSMTESQRIRHNHDQTEAAWKRAERIWRSDPDYQDHFPRGLNECKAGIALCREIKRAAV